MLWKTKGLVGSGQETTEYDEKATNDLYLHNTILQVSAFKSDFNIREFDRLDHTSTEYPKEIQILYLVPLS